MILILISVVCLLVISIYIISEINNFLAEALAVFGIFSSVIWLVSYPFLTYSYIASGYKMDIINKEFNTAYTQAEIFYASDVIDEIRELKRKRIEINGDLITGDSK